ncbi:hypothetical protein HYU16_01415 [Candidatus Woesearchaeota archaeon]|nr:hypothetical protein [Candidatus Woesearchaeota archaeon]
MKKLLVAALALETIVLAACGHTDKTVATQPPPTAAPSPISSPQPESGLQSILLEYYTKSKGQLHYDNSVLDDLIVIRYYVLDPESNATSIIAVAYGLIDGLKLSEGKLYFKVRPLPSQDPYDAFVEKSLPPPLIVPDGTIINQRAVAHRFPEPTLLINFTGLLPLQAPAMPPDPFWMVRIVDSRGIMGSAQTQFLQIGDTGQTYTFVVLPLTVYQDGKVVQKVGIGLMELIILDTQAPENRASLDGSSIF